MKLYPAWTVPGLAHIASNSCSFSCGSALLELGYLLPSDDPPILGICFSWSTPVVSSWKINRTQLWIFPSPGKYTLHTVMSGSLFSTTQYYGSCHGQDSLWFLPTSSLGKYTNTQSSIFSFSFCFTASCIASEPFGYYLLPIVKQPIPAYNQ